MLSETVLSDVALTPGTAGTVQSLNLGAISLKQFSSQVNWRNSRNYASEPCLPWANLSPVTIPKEVVSLVAAAEVIPDVPPPVVAQIAEPAAVEYPNHVASALPDRLLPTNSETDSPQPVNEHVSEDAPADEPVNGKPTVQEQVTVQSPKDERTLPEQTVREETLAKPSSAQSDDRITKTLPPKVSKPLRNETSEIRDQANDPQVLEVAQVNVREPTVTPQNKEQVAAHREPMQVRIASADPVRLPSHSNEDYVARLERLVLYLNLDLAQSSLASHGNEKRRSIHEQGSLLARRIIDLSLENLALREELSELAN